MEVNMCEVYHNLECFQDVLIRSEGRHIISVLGPCPDITITCLLPHHCSRSLSHLFHCTLSALSVEAVLWHIKGLFHNHLDLISGQGAGKHRLLDLSRLPGD